VNIYYNMIICATSNIDLIQGVIGYGDDEGTTDWRITNTKTAVVGQSGIFNILNNTSTIPKFSIIDDGNVGIGTSPIFNNKLILYDDITNTTTLSITNNNLFSTLNSSIELNRGVIGDSNLNFKIGNYNSEFKIISSISSIDTERFNITSSGNVGIGTSPSISSTTKLEIVGSVNISGTYNINNRNVINDTSNYVLSTYNLLNTAKQNVINSTANQIIIGNGNGITTTNTGLTFTNNTLFATNIAGAGITGLAATQIPSLDAAKITTGTFTATQIPVLDAAKITTGTLLTSVIPSLDAGKITTGTFTATQIPVLDSAKITSGTLLTGVIPSLDANKITTGTLLTSVIPSLDAGKITTGTLLTSTIPSLDANKITTGTLLTSIIPSLDASKITAGTLPVARGGTGATTFTAGQILIGNSTAIFQSGNLSWDSVNNWLNVSGTVNCTYLRPSTGSGNNGIIWPSDPGGGSGDSAWIKYYVRSAESCTLEIGLGNDVDDNIYFNTVGGVGIGVATPATKLHVVGDIYATGSITAQGNITAYQTLSDDRLKTKIANISDPLRIIDKLNGFYYKVNELGHSYGIINTETEIGLSAQEVQKVLPELVDIAPFDKSKDNEGNKISKSGENYLSISYERMAPIFVEAIKELNEKNRELTEKYNLLLEQIINKI
jgi:hypothetical protein